MIEGVEELGAKLCFEPLSNVEAFCNTSALTPGVLSLWGDKKQILLKQLK
jgi:hypothetical protein